MKNNEFFKGMIFLILAQSMVATNIVGSKVLVASFPVMVLLLIRFALATIVLLPLHWTTPARANSIWFYLSKLSYTDWIFMIAQALCAGSLFNLLMLAGLKHTDANVAGIITSALPAIIAVMSWLVLREKISMQKGICVAFATIGLAVIAYGKLTTIGEAHSFWGDLIVLLSLFPEAAYYILCKLNANRLPVFLVSAIMNAVNTILLLPFVVCFYASPLNVSLIDGIILIVIGLSSGLFYVFWFLGAKKVDGIMSSLSTAVMPVATVVLACIVLGEDLSLFEFIGMGLVILSIVMYAKR